jgi:copper chaperone CopZ
MAVEKAVFDVPRMYADHHVEAVRSALTQLQGVQDIYASSAFKRVAVSYDAQKVNPKAIENTLAEAGYAPDEEWQLPKTPEGKEDNSPWFQTLQRVTTTNRADLEASGDHRKY